MPKQLSFFSFFAILLYHNLLLFAQKIVFAQPTVISSSWVSGDSDDMAQPQEPVFQFTPSCSHDFGAVLQADWVSYDFVFTNTGNMPLIISRVKGSCYCTKAEWSPKAVAAGGQGYVRVFYDTRNKIGKFRAAVSILSNAFGSDTEHLFVEGEIINPSK